PRRMISTNPWWWKTATTPQPTARNKSCRPPACQPNSDGLALERAGADYADFPKGKILGAPPGFAKLIVERGSDQILGFHMIGAQAANLVHKVVVAMNAGQGTAQLVRDSIHTHPRLTELVSAVFAAAT